MATFYVKHSTGSDADAGTQVAPWAHAPGMIDATDVAAATVLAPGDSVLFCRGETWSKAAPAAAWWTIPASGDAISPITFGAYGGGAKPIISVTTATAFPTVYIAGKYYLLFDNLEVRHYSDTYTDVSSILACGFYLYTPGGVVPHDITITNCKITLCPYMGVYSNGDAYNIQIGESPSFAGPTATTVVYNNEICNVGGGGVYLRGYGPDQLSNFYIKGNYIHDITCTDTGSIGYAVQVSAGSTLHKPSHTWIEYNYVADSKWELIDTHNGDYVYIRYNYTHGNANNSIMCSAGVEAGVNHTGDHIWIVGNTMRNDPAAGDRGSSSFIWANGESGMSLTNVWIQNNDIDFISTPTTATHDGIHLGYTEGVEISGNTFGPVGNLTCNAGAIYLATGRTSVTTITQNFVRGWGRGIYLVSSANVGTQLTIANNIFEACTNTFVVDTAVLPAGLTLDLLSNSIQQEAANGNFVDFETSGCIAVGVTVNIKNNIFSYKALGGYRWFIYHTGAVAGTLNCDYNLYGNCTGATGPFRYNGASLSLAQWQALAFTPDANPAAKTIDDDPAWVNAGGSYLLATDFQIPAVSPARDAGTVTGITTDYSGNLRLDPPGFDIGAYEYQPPGGWVGVSFW